MVMTLARIRIPVIWAVCLGVIAQTACAHPQPVNGDTSARPRGLLAAKYPDAFHAANAEGDVVIDIAIDRAGRVDSARTKIRASSHRLLEMSVRAATDTIAWFPATSAGAPIPSVRRDTFSFVLRDSAAVAKDSAAVCPKSSEHHHQICAGAVSTRSRMD
jgi:TonB family protein